MRLIDVEMLVLHEFVANVPPYAILSHTWGDDEVTFDDMSSGAAASKKGFAKIRETCRLARENGLRYAWIDTCTIDKRSSADLSESINSMFQWYRDATVCFAHLEDLSPSDPDSKLKHCRWFTRGWTLQELIAPKTVHFYDQAWRCRGSKDQFADAISSFTRIPSPAFLGTDLGYFSVAQRMSWAALRQTTRVEDAAYCLLGIFDVNLPMIYGEGAKAFRRLQEEVLKHTGDLTALAWDDSADDVGLFASSPLAFARSWNISADIFASFASQSLDISVTTKGLLISDKCILIHVEVLDGVETVELYLLPLGRTTRNDRTSLGGICLRKLGSTVFYRDRRFSLVGFGRSDYKVVGHSVVSRIYISPAPMGVRQATHGGLQIPRNRNFSLELAAPDELWYITERSFLLDKLGLSVWPSPLLMIFTCNLLDSILRIAVVCEHEFFLVPRFKIFSNRTNPTVDIWEGEHGMIKAKAPAALIESWRQQGWYSQLSDCIYDGDIRIQVHSKQEWTDSDFSYQVLFKIEPGS